MWMPRDESLVDTPTPYSDAHQLVDFETRLPIHVEGVPVVGLHVARTIERRLIWRSGYYHKLFKELREEKNEWKRKCQALNNSIAAEGMDPNGTIWEHADKLRKELEEAKTKIDRQAERIRYLEGATNHATGTPLSKAAAENEQLRREGQTKMTEMAHRIAQLEADIQQRAKATSVLLKDCLTESYNGPLPGYVRDLIHNHMKDIEHLCSPTGDMD